MSKRGHGNSGSPRISTSTCLPDDAGIIRQTTDHRTFFDWALSDHFPGKIFSLFLPHCGWIYFFTPLDNRSSSRNTIKSFSSAFLFRTLKWVAAPTPADEPALEQKLQQQQRRRLLLLQLWDCVRRRHKIL